MKLDDLDFADDLALLSQTQQQIQEKTTSVAAASTVVGLSIHKGKSKILLYNAAFTNPITLDGEAFKDVKTFTYLDTIIDEHTGSDTHVKAQIGKARDAYLQVNNIYNSKQLSVNQHQIHNFQYKCQHSSTVWSGNLKNYENHHPQHTGVYEQLSTQNTSDPLRPDTSLSVTTYCVREQTRINQWRNKSGRSV
ncbi:unnamed protein product [Schistosoma mattheei]|uniref:Uncharacterized protein n=1 Tax=Schistosoma mattheei TaxID=31246 RepID=A0A183P4E6_9TREM|nr:unnamed protein product [Schistosoma mattheei]